MARGGRRQGAGRPKGVPNKDKPFALALRLEIQDATKKGLRDLRRVARSLLDKAASGDVPAIREVADRLDGKVAQALEGSPTSPITVKIVD
jgi:Family of unknown function (DUF5681)